MKRSDFMNENKTNINWYPGHMAKTRRQIKENINMVDIIYEVVDSRIPISSKIKDLDESNKSLVESNSALKKENLSLKEWISILKDKIYKIKTMLLTEVINKIIPKSFFEKLENMGLFKTERPKEKERTRE